MKDYFILSILTIGVAILIMANLKIENRDLGGIPISPNTALGSNTSVAVTSTAKVVLAEASNAQLRIISNVGAADAWLSATTTNLKADFGFWLKASSSQVFSGDSLYLGNIYASSTVGGTTLSILQL